MARISKEKLRHLRRTYEFLVSPYNPNRVTEFKVTAKNKQMLSEMFGEDLKIGEKMRIKPTKLTPEMEAALTAEPSPAARARAQAFLDKLKQKRTPS